MSLSVIVYLVIACLSDRISGSSQFPQTDRRGSVFTLRRGDVKIVTRIGFKRRRNESSFPLSSPLRRSDERRADPRQRGSGMPTPISSLNSVAQGEFPLQIPEKEKREHSVRKRTDAGARAGRGVQI